MSRRRSEGKEVVDPAAHCLIDEMQVLYQAGCIVEWHVNFAGPSLLRGMSSDFRDVYTFAQYRIESNYSRSKVKLNRNACIDNQWKEQTSAYDGSQLS